MGGMRGRRKVGVPGEGEKKGGMARWVRPPPQTSDQVYATGKKKVPKGGFHKPPVFFLKKNSGQGS
jgi:hypothetical protein